jgi:hypothetical protein
MTILGAFVSCNGMLGAMRAPHLARTRSTGLPYRLGQVVTHRSSVIRRADDERIATAR